ncbi:MULTISPECIES: hypothetical protein [unclassified Flavobacterium]|jgi:hypothetical protein|uniref:hypothetical protein n=1 Tax=unclassified Flavobacterium TaxID=196869 RepID=UPI0025BDB339|nr:MULTISPECIES: hypothetical protein [unclassified Flavobacterium]
MHLLKINLHGESWTLKKFECSEDDLDECLKVAGTMKVPLVKAVLDPFFYYYLKIPSIQSVEHLPGKKWTGLLNTPKNQIEIVLDGKKIKKLHFKDLNQEQLLFPLYNIHKTKITEEYSPGIYVEQKAIGFIASYEIKVDDFNIDELQFHLLQFNNKQLLQKPSYQNKKVLFRKKETLLIYQNSFEVL